MGGCTNGRNVGEGSSGWEIGLEGRDGCIVPGSWVAGLGGCDRRPVSEGTWDAGLKARDGFEVLWGVGLDAGDRFVVALSTKYCTA